MVQDFRATGFWAPFKGIYKGSFKGSIIRVQGLGLMV